MGLMDFANKLGTIWADSYTTPQDREAARIARQAKTSSGLMSGIFDRNTDAGYRERFDAEQQRRLEAEQQKYTGFRGHLSPEALQGEKDRVARTFQAPTKEQRWLKTIQDMVTSGNHTLQEQGLKMMEPHSQGSIGKQYDKTGQRKDWLAAVNDGSFNGTFVQWLDRYKNTGTSVNNFVNTANDTISRADASAMRNSDGVLVDVPVGMTYREAYDRGWTYSNTPSADEAMRSSRGQVAVKELRDIRSAVKHLGEQGRNFITGIVGNWDTFREKSTPEGQIFNAILDLAGFKQDPKNAEIRARLRTVNSTISRMLTGLDMPKHEVDSIMSQLPNPEQPDAVFFANIDAQIKVMTEVNELVQKARGQGKTIPTIGIGKNPAIGRPERNEVERSRNAAY